MDNQQRLFRIWRRLLGSLSRPLKLLWPKLRKQVLRHSEGLAGRNTGAVKRLEERDDMLPIEAETTIGVRASAESDLPVRLPNVLLGDIPIRLPEHDAFGIDPFARAVASSIRDADAREGLVFAVNGVWGAGKSSAINLILHHLAVQITAEEIIATTFNPWWFSGAEALTISFFQELRATVGKSLDEKAREAMASLGSRLSAAGPLLGGLASLLATPAAGAAVVGGATLIEKFTRLESTVEIEQRKLVEALAKQNKKFLIVIDDIDRLATDDALQLFKLIKTVGRLPNVIYLMAFDWNLAEKMVANRFPAEGISYLEKVIQGAFDLPTPDRDDLSAQLYETAVEVMGAPPSEKMQRFLNLFHDGVAPLLKTPRDVVRLMNAIKVSWPAIGANVDRADFLTIEAMRLLLPSTYKAVREHPDMLIGTAPDDSHDGPALELEYNAVFLDHLETAREREIAKRALRRLFPRLDGIWSNTRHSGSSRWQRDRLICASEHFPTYFCFDVKNDGITSAESDFLIRNAGTPGATAKALRRFLAMPRKKGGTRAALALDELSVRAGDIVPDDLQQFITDLFSIADELNVPADRSRGFTAIASNVWRLHWLLNNVLRDRLDLLARSQIICGAAPFASLAWLLSLSTRCKPAMATGGGVKETDHEKLVDDDTANWLNGLCLDRIRAAALDGTLLQSTEMLDILRGWSERAGAEEVRDWTDHHLDNDAFVVTLAKDLVQEIWSAGIGGFGDLGDRVARKSDYLHLEPILPILDVARLRERIASMLNSAGLDPAAYTSLKRFQAARERVPEHSA